MLHVKRILWEVLLLGIITLIVEAITLLPKIGVALFLFGVALFGASYLFGAMITDVIIPQIKEMTEKKKWESGKR